MPNIKNDKYRQKWSREETILALELYCRIPFGSIGKTNPLIIELADMLGRTPSSVGLKLANLASYDPKLKERNVSGMYHTSKLDGEIFYEFYQNLSELSYQAETIKAGMQGKTVEQFLDEFDIDVIPPGEYRETVAKRRIGQYYFRQAILVAYGNRCCVTGLKQPDLLLASHIKPWKVSNAETERTNPCNGLCLNALHDRAFDKGLITINNQYEIVISKAIKNAEMDSETLAWFMSYDQKPIILPDKFLPGKRFIEYHNDVVFLG